MFRYIILYIFILFSPVLLKSQNFRGGLIGGLTASQVDGDSYAGFDKVGVHGGVFVNTGFSNLWGFQLEIKYTGRGARKKNSVEDPSIYKLSLNYIDLPLFLWLNYKEKITIEGGFLTGYLFYIKGEDSNGPLPSENINNFKKFDYCWLLGFRYNLNDYLSFGIRYSYSLFSISKVKNNDGKYGIIANLFNYTTGDYNNYLTFSLFFRILK